MKMADRVISTGWMPRSAEGGWFCSAHKDLGLCARGVSELFNTDVSRVTEIRVTLWRTPKENSVPVMVTLCSLGCVAIGPGFFYTRKMVSDVDEHNWPAVEKFGAWLKSIGKPVTLHAVLEVR
jgi:hypothetical protein